MNVLLAILMLGAVFDVNITESKSKKWGYVALKIQFTTSEKPLEKVYIIGLNKDNEFVELLLYQEKPGTHHKVDFIDIVKYRQIRKWKYYDGKQWEKENERQKEHLKQLFREGREAEERAEKARKRLDQQKEDLDEWVRKKTIELEIGNEQLTKELKELHKENKRKAKEEIDRVKELLRRLENEPQKNEQEANEQKDKLKKILDKLEKILKELEHLNEGE